MGAVYLDQGYEFTNRLLINRIYFQALNLDELTESEIDFKSRLIEWCQKNHLQDRIPHGQRQGVLLEPPRILLYGAGRRHRGGTRLGRIEKEAEQHAAVSVAEYMTDEQCASLLDRVTV